MPLGIVAYYATTVLSFALKVNYCAINMLYFAITESSSVVIGIFDAITVTCRAVTVYCFLVTCYNYAIIVPYLDITVTYCVIKMFYYFLLLSLCHNESSHSSIMPSL